MENVTDLLVSRILPRNIDEHSPDNLFTPTNIPIPTSLIATLNKLSLHTINFLESTKSDRKKGKSKLGLPWRPAPYKCATKILKTILKITYVEGVHAIIHTLENNDLFAHYIAKVPVLLLRKGGESVTKSRYCLNDGPFGRFALISMKVA